MLPTWHEAAQRLAHLKLPQTSIRKPLDATLVGRVLAEDVTAFSPNPRFRMSAMDGWAIHPEDMEAGSKRLVIQDTVLAGMAAPTLRPGTTCAVMTGAPVPHETCAVIPVEDAEASDGTLTWQDLLKAGQNIREQGEDFAEGQMLLHVGTVLYPQHLVLLRTAGIQEVDVYQASRVSLIQTGNELAEGDHPLHEGSVYESTRECIVESLRKLGPHPLTCQQVRDEKDSLSRAIGQALEDGNDLILTTGGVSKGVADHVPEVVKALGGDIVLHRLAIKPGKPLLVARFPSGAILVGLPGNPMAQLLACQAAVFPLLQGKPMLTGMMTAPATLLEPCKGKETFRTFLRGVVFVSAQGQLVVRPLAGNDSHRVRNLATCNAWLHATGSHAEGSLIEVSPFMDTQWRLGPCPQ